MEMYTFSLNIIRNIEKTAARPHNDGGKATRTTAARRWQNGGKASIAAGGPPAGRRDTPPTGRRRQGCDYRRRLGGCAAGGPAVARLRFAF